MADRQKGFTLVEAAIVLVVIGLLVGGVTAGQQLVRGAYLRKLISDNDGYRSAILGFSDRYASMPGDYSRASIHVRCQPACLNGNGNQRVETNATPIAGSEVHEELLVWSHLSGAGFISGNYVQVAGGTVPTLQNSPVNVFQRYWVFVYDGNFDTTPSGAMRHNLKTGNQIPVDFLQEIDARIDDGLPNTGSFRFSALAFGGPAPVGGAPAAPNCTSAATTTAVWNSTNGTQNCGAANLF